MARLASLTVDARAPVELSSAQKFELANNPRVIRPGQRNKAMTQKIHKLGYKRIADAEGTTVFEKKKRKEQCLNTAKKRLRDSMIKQAWKRHFRAADTQAFETHFSAAALPSASIQSTQRVNPIAYNIPERATVVQLVCGNNGGLSDEARYHWRIQAIKARTALRRRQEAQRRGQPKITEQQEESICPVSDSDASAKSFRIVCGPLQCLFCVGNESLAPTIDFTHIPRPTRY